MELKKIDAGIKLVRANGKRFNDLVQKLGVAIIRHAEEHGDCSRALTLVQALPNNFKARTRLVEWFKTYSPIGMNVGKGIVRINKGDKASRFNALGAEANPWFVVPEAEIEEVPDTTLLDVRDMIEKLSKRITKRVEDGKVAANDKDTIKVLTDGLVKLAQVA